VDRLTLGSKREAPTELLAAWLTETPHALIALDAPLGWPAALGAALHTHRAGDPLTPDATALFTRLTDRRLHARTGKRPLEVGADRIARTARAALELLQHAREASGQPIPLAWAPSAASGARAIEVYPAGTLAAAGAPSSQYKDPGSASRTPIIAALRARINLPSNFDAMAAPGDLLDALICLWAGLDFLEGLALGPSAGEQSVAEHEGWIWVRGAGGGQAAGAAHGPW
jgi:predicted RNase H-like nuclease